MIKTLRTPYSYLHGAFQFIIWRTKYSNELPTSEQFLIGVLTRPPRRNFVHLFGRSNSSASKNFYPFMRWMVLIKKFVRQKDGWTSEQSANGRFRLWNPGLGCPRDLKSGHRKQHPITVLTFSVIYYIFHERWGGF